MAQDATLVGHRCSVTGELPLLVAIRRSLTDKMISSQLLVVHNHCTDATHSLIRRRLATGPARSRWVTEPFEDAAVQGKSGIDNCMRQWTDDTRRLFRNDGGSESM